MKYFLIVLTAFVIVSCTKKQEQPNILFVFADQLRSHELSCYGGINIKTPNLDRLAQEGLQMTNAISTYPVCTPFRGMLMTGSYPMHTGIVCNDHPRRDALPSIAEACKAADYQTGYIGKWHLDGIGRTTYIPPERRMGFEFWQALECTHSYFESKYFENDSDELKQWEGYDAEAQTESAQNYIRNRDKNRPFFLMLSWGPPHDPYIAPEKYMKRVDPEKLVLRPNLKEKEIESELVTNMRFNLHNNIENKRTPERMNLADEEHVRKNMLHGYLASTLAIDDYLGELLKTLKEEKILDNTIIVFTSDHGDHLGSHRFKGKCTPFEESISIPFLIRYPEKILQKTISDALLAPIDMMPTILGMAGIDYPKIDGQDLSEVITNKRSDTRDEILIMGMTHLNTAALVNSLDTWRGLRTKQYTYARYEDQTSWLLYDNEKDPYQMNNLADNPQYSDLIEAFNKKLDLLLEEAGDEENTKNLYDKIIEEESTYLLRKLREVNPGRL
jgi:arylsulfatase A-like enzyme